MVWPLESTGTQRFADGLDEILVVEEKRQVLEYQLKEECSAGSAAARKIPRVVGKFDDKDGGEWAVPQGNWLLPAHYEFSPAMVAKAIASRLLRFALPRMCARHPGAAGRHRRARTGAGAPAWSRSKPWFCSGCPHNTSTRVPEGSRGMAGIGCHYMVTWMGRNTQAYAQMGGEGVPWIGQAPFTDEKHVFANLGDGTFHSGLLAIRAAVAAKAPITYKILFNDAVAMTGGQPVDGPISVPMISRQVAAEGIDKIVVVTDAGQVSRHGRHGAGVPVHHRDELDAVMRELRDHAGVSVLIYDQTCATEAPAPQARRLSRPGAARAHQRARVRGLWRLFGAVPLSVGRAAGDRVRSQARHQPVQLQQGFLLSEGLLPQLRDGGRRQAAQAAAAGAGRRDRRHPAGARRAGLARPYGVFIAGVGGTGVVTIGQLLGMAAHIEGRGCSVLDMAGLAQKGGAVYSHVVLAAAPDQLMNTRVAMGEADLVLAGDLVATSADAMARLSPGRTRVLLNDTAPTAAFVKNPDWTLPGAAGLQLEGVCGKEHVDTVDAAALAVALLGDAIYANPLMMGYAYQKLAAAVARVAAARHRA